MTEVTRESLAAALEGLSRFLSEYPKADVVPLKLIVPLLAALPSPAPEPPPEERLVDARELGGNKGNAQYLAAQPAPDLPQYEALEDVAGAGWKAAFGAWPSTEPEWSQYAELWRNFMDGTVAELIKRGWVLHARSGRSQEEA